MRIVKLYQFKIIALLLIFVLSQLSITAASKEGLLAGAAKVKITPETPVPMSGYGGRKDPFKAVHDDIYARVVVFSDGENMAAIISVEVIGISHTFWEECTELISKETKIPREYILLSAVHNHSGPALNIYKEASPDVSSYIKELQMKLTEATKDAINILSPATIGSGNGECLMNINRRASDGKGGVTLGRNPYGPCDHEVGVIRVNDISGNPLSVLVDWPCHAVCLGPKNYFISGDWPGAASDYIEKEIGNGVIAPIIVGASGDINPIYGPHVDFEENGAYSYGKDAIGEDLANVAMSVVENIETSNDGKIRASQRVIYLPAKEKNEKTQQPESMKDDSLMVRLSALKIGKIVITGISGELFNQVSVKIRAKSPYTNTFMVTHCNGSSGYLVTDDSYPIGGYEVRSTRAKPGAEGIIIDNLLELINEL